MPTIKFTATPELPFDIAHLGYKAGDVLEMNDASARRWVRRGVAVYWTDDKQAAYDSKVERKTKLALEALPGLAAPTEVDNVVAVLAPKPVAIEAGFLPPYPTGGVTTSWSEDPDLEHVAVEIAADEDAEIGDVVTFAGHEPTVATDESPKRRGRPRR